MQMWWIFVCSRTNATEHFSPTEFGAGAFCYSNSSREFTHLNNYRMWFDTDVTDFAYVTSARANRGNGNLLFACHRFTAPTVLIWFEITHFKQKTTATSPHTHVNTTAYVFRISHFCSFSTRTISIWLTRWHKMYSQFQNMKHQRKIDIAWHDNVFFPVSF